MRAQLSHAIQHALEALGAADAHFVVERPTNMSHGDYSTNAALVASKFIARPPHALAEELKARLDQAAVHGVESIEIAGPGFINFFLTQATVAAAVVKAATDEAPTVETDAARMTIMVEYTQPNPFKPFHIGHLMSNAIGESLVRLLRFTGATVVAVNYQGDVGLHIAKALWGLQKKGYSADNIEHIAEAYVFGSASYEDDEDARKEIMMINKQVYAGDPAILAAYMQGRELTLAHFEKIYRMLETQFDHYFFESEVWHSGEALVHEGLAHGVFEESEGAVVFRGEKFGLHTRVFITREGLPTYEAKDLGLALAKLAYVPFDLSITTTAVEQKEYFKVVFEALAQLRPDLRGKFTSITHGMMRFASGKMSSRKGNVITGESLLRDLIDASKEKIGSRELKDADTVAEQVAVGAIKYAILKQGSGKDIVFDPEKSLSLEGDSGPYLQYAHTRAVSLLKMAKEANIVPAIEGAGGLPAAASPRSPAAQAGNPPAPISRETLERTLIHFPGVLERAADELEPHHVTTYLTELASAFNAWYASERVIGSETQEWGICLTRAFANTMRRGLEALGIPVPEEM